MDLNMPIMGGIEAAKKILELYGMYFNELHLYQEPVKLNDGQEIIIAIDTGS